MTYDVVVYISSVAHPEKHSRKIECLESFAQGVTHAGGRVHVERTNTYTPSRLAVILGWATPASKGGSNIALRKQIISEQQRNRGHTMCIDASCFKYLDNQGTYLRYSIGGPYYDQANYANQNSTADRWNKISAELKISLEPQQHTDNGHVLICMQRDGGFAMKEIKPLAWLDQKISQLRIYTKRPIVIRPHPGAYKPRDFAKYRGQRNITVVDPLATKLTDNLKNAHSAVFFNSSASVAAVCAGVPIFVDDQSCVSWAVANKHIANINSPQWFERSQWMHDLAAAHWSDADAQQGLIFQKFLPHLV
jgi:hypothetical protein